MMMPAVLATILLATTAAALDGWVGVLSPLFFFVFLYFFPDTHNSGLKEPSLTRPELVLYMPKPPALRKQTEPNLKKTLGELCSDGDILTVTEETWASDRSLSVILRFTK